MRRWSLLIVFVVLSLFSCAGVDHRAATGPVDLTILHVNDTHGRVLPYLEKTVDPASNVSGSAYLAALVEQERARNPQGTLLLSAGDMFQGTPISNVFRGEPMIAAMNAIGFDAMALGNHEFDWGMDALQALRQKALFPFLTANIADSAGKGPAGAVPYVVVERKGLKIAVIGLTTTEVAYTTKPGYVRDLKVLKPETVLPGLVQRVRSEGARMVVVLSHIGFEEDKTLARAVDGIDVIVGGHSHTAVKEPVRVGRTVVVQAGWNGIYLGTLRCRLNPEAGEDARLSAEGGLTLVSAGPGRPYDGKVAQMIEAYNVKIKTEFAEVVGETAVDLITSKTSETNIGNLMTDAMREAANADIAFQNSGGFRVNLPKGKLTMEHVYTLLPFDNTLVSMDLPGSAVLALLEQSGGGEYGFLQMSGASVAYDMTKPAGSRVMRALVSGKPLDPARTYRVATNDFAASGGDRLLPFKEGRNLVYGDELRDVFVAYLKGRSPVSPGVEGRIVVNR
jgi:5'-nucleotidase / UDP-sugar diphosphatase